MERLVADVERDRVNDRPARTVLFATRNPFKKRLFAPLFGKWGLECVSLVDIGAKKRVAERGRTPEENALHKARAFHCPQWPLVFGDDAGLEIDALHGEPGIQARRWNGRFADHVDDETWLAYLLKRMQGIPLPERTARYVAAWVLLTPDGQAHVHRIQIPFQIAERPVRPIRPGSPLSAVEIGPGTALAERIAQIEAEWERWGIGEHLLTFF